MQTVRIWLDRFAARVRERDYAGAEALFDEQVHSFGTVAEAATGRDALRSRQWQYIWPITRGFRFDEPSIRIRTSPDARMAVANALWTSEAVQTEPSVLRHGRATLVLERVNLSAPWRAVHSHFSISPSART